MHGVCPIYEGVLERGQNRQFCCQKTRLRIPVDGALIPGAGQGDTTYLGGGSLCDLS